MSNPRPIHTEPIFCTTDGHDVYEPHLDILWTSFPPSQWGGYETPEICIGWHNTDRTYVIDAQLEGDYRELATMSVDDLPTHVAWAVRRRLMTLVKGIEAGYGKPPSGWVSAIRKEEKARRKAAREAKKS